MEGAQNTIGVSVPSGNRCSVSIGALCGASFSSLFGHAAAYFWFPSASTSPTTSTHAGQMVPSGKRSKCDLATSGSAVRTMRQ
jgi:hypothetical protein